MLANLLQHKRTSSVFKCDVCDSMRRPATAGALSLPSSAENSTASNRGGELARRLAATEYCRLSRLQPVGLIGAWRIPARRPLIG
jgi:hypothetical protein